jgi:hypothetical protein
LLLTLFDLGIQQLHEMFPPPLVDSSTQVRANFQGWFEDPTQCAGEERQVRYE